MTGRILYIPMNQEVALHLLTFKLLRISAKAALEKGQDIVVFNGSTYIFIRETFQASGR